MDDAGNVVRVIDKYVAVIEMHKSGDKLQVYASYWRREEKYSGT